MCRGLLPTGEYTRRHVFALALLEYMEELQLFWPSHFCLPIYCIDPPRATCHLRLSTVAEFNISATSNRLRDQRGCRHRNARVGHSRRGMFPPNRITALRPSAGDGTFPHARPARGRVVLSKTSESAALSQKSIRLRHHSNACIVTAHLSSSRTLSRPVQTSHWHIRTKVEHVLHAQ